MKKTEKMWAIAGRFGLYAGVFFTRGAAVDLHCSGVGKTWAQCKRDGDYAVKVTVSYEVKP